MLNKFAGHAWLSTMLGVTTEPFLTRSQTILFWWLRGTTLLLTITTTHRPATDLGYLLHKNPARAQSFALGFGQVHFFYPEATEECCTAGRLDETLLAALE